MNEIPLASQDLALVNLPGQAGEGREHAAALMPVPHSMPHTKGPAKQPRFAITSVKLREAFLHRWKLAVTVGLVLAGVGAALAYVTYQPKYTATAIMQMQSVASRLIPRDRNHDEYGDEAFRKTLTF